MIVGTWGHNIYDQPNIITFDVGSPEITISHQCFLKLRKTESLREADFGQRISKLSTKTKSKKEILLLLGGFLRMSRY